MRKSGGEADISSASSPLARPDARLTEYPVRLAAGEMLPLHRLASHRLLASGFAEAVELERGRRPDVVRVVIEWPDVPSPGVDSR